ncbi:hypothetical protein CHS0354_028007 [Potamilus streckersoni]|uniref:Ig-like domain-containing protein n=1 Tax=Potamilus streckersoni TaxID=2493646 RepID=A0AAE0T4G4_9BIVA|nr:hypothetical protein CHS0354_028007 [Potamilus streckersoni]
MLLDVDISDAGIYYITDDDLLSDAFIITIMDYPKQPVILLRSHETESNVGPYELHCASESKRHPTFTRKELSFTWRLNGHNLTELQPCFRLSGPILTLCMDACGLGENENISISCTAHDDGLQSNESEPFIVSASRATSAWSAKDTDYQAKQTTWILVAACIGSFIIGGLLSSSLKLLVKKRCTVCRKEHREEGRSTDVSNDTLHVNTVMMMHAKPEGEVPSRISGDRNEPFHINSVVDSRSIITETETTRQYEVLDQTRMEYPNSQYTVMLSKGSGHVNEPEMYENF